MWLGSCLFIITLAIILILWSLKCISRTLATSSGEIPPARSDVCSRTPAWTTRRDSTTAASTSRMTSISPKRSSPSSKNQSSSCSTSDASWRTWRFGLGRTQASSRIPTASPRKSDPPNTSPRLSILSCMSGRRRSSSDMTDTAIDRATKANTTSKRWPKGWNKPRATSIQVTAWIWVDLTISTPVRGHTSTKARRLWGTPSARGARASPWKDQSDRHIIYNILISYELQLRSCKGIHLEVVHWVGYSVAFGVHTHTQPLPGVW